MYHANNIDREGHESIDLYPIVKWPHLAIQPSWPFHIHLPRMWHNSWRMTDFSINKLHTIFIKTETLQIWIFQAALHGSSDVKVDHSTPRKTPPEASRGKLITEEMPDKSTKGRCYVCLAHLQVYTAWKTVRNIFQHWPSNILNLVNVLFTCAHRIAYIPVLKCMRIDDLFAPGHYIILESLAPSHLLLNVFVMYQVNICLKLWKKIRA